MNEAPPAEKKISVKHKKFQELKSRTAQEPPRGIIFPLTYCAFCEAAGIEPNSLDDYQMMTFEGFLGSFYANLGSRPMATNPDTVYAWIPMGTNELTYTGTDGVEVSWAVIQDVSGWTQGSLYSCFAGGDQVWAEIHNPTIHDGSSCVVVKDPYGNWIIKVQMSDASELEGLMDAAAYKAFIGE